jgi:hypothetical protein
MHVRRAALLALALVALATPGAAHAELAALQAGAEPPTGARAVAPSLGIWRVPFCPPHALACGPDRLMHRFEARATPTDPLLPQEWWLAAVGADRVTPPPPASARRVSVIDTGVDLTQPDMAAMDIVQLNAQRTPARGEEHHGTAVASIIAAPADGKGMVGVFPGAGLASYDVGGQTLAEVLTGIAAALQQPVAGILNLSVGFEGPAGSNLLQIGVDSAIAAGWVVVAAAGNAGDRGSPATYPADLPHVVTVAATDKNGNVASFSNRSPFTDLAAPGVNIVAAVPTWKDPSGYATLSGTSFAAPIVAGAAAWLWTSRPALDATQVAAILHRSAHDIGAAGVDEESGWGLLDIPAALALPAPIRDPQEPNDDVRFVADRGVFGVGTTPLVDTVKATNRVAARLSPADDPADVYRLLVPPGREVTARLRAGRDVRIALWGPGTQGIGEAATLRRRDLISSGRSVHTRATGRKPAYYYLAATLAPGAPEESYLIDVKLRGAPSPPTSPPGGAAASSAPARSPH